MQMHSDADAKMGSRRGRGEFTKESGYEPSNDDALPVAVFVQATNAGAESQLEVRVTENGDEVARMTAAFSSDARLEKDAHGRLNLLMPLPPRSDGMIKGVWRDDVGDIKPPISYSYSFGAPLVRKWKRRRAECVSRLRRDQSNEWMAVVCCGACREAEVISPATDASRRVVSKDVRSYAGSHPWLADDGAALRG